MYSLLFISILYASTCVHMYRNMRLRRVCISSMYCGGANNACILLAVLKVLTINTTHCVHTVIYRCVRWRAGDVGTLHLYNSMYYFSSMIIREFLLRD